VSVVVVSTPDAGPTSVSVERSLALNASEGVLSICAPADCGPSS
jgi:hypothetical protein